MTKRRSTFGFSFSWRRATGLSTAKGRLSRAIGVPLTKSGRERKLGRAMGCAVALCLLGLAAGATVAIAAVLHG